MKYVIQKHIITALLGLIFVAPFFILEWVTTSGFERSGFPLTLFLFMWVNSTLFVCVLPSVFKDLRAGAVQSRVLWFGLRVLALVILGWAFVHIVIDQMPCFLGASGC